MKKLLLTTMLTLSCFCVSNAQGKGDVEFGVNVGYNSSRVYESQTNLRAASNIGINVGFAADYYFSDRWSVKAKLIYDQKGWDEGVFENFVAAYPADFSLNYLTIPVMANWHFGRERNWYLNFGPYAGFLFDAEESARGTDVRNGLNSTDFGLSVGIGVKIPLSNKIKIHFEYEAQSGLAEIFRESFRTRTSNSRAAFNVGVNFLMK